MQKKKEVEKSPEKVVLTLEKPQAAMLWHLVRDLLIDDNRRKSDGSGGFIYPHELSLYFTTLETIAKALDGQ